MSKIEFFFDCSSPFTYLAFHNVQTLAGEVGAEIVWRPILVGGVFNTINPSVYASRQNPVPSKERYMRKDLQDAARLAGLTLKFPPSVFPVNSTKAMRGCILLEPQGKLVPFAAAAFDAYWAGDRDISEDAVLTDICSQIGVDGARFLEGIAQPSIKDALRANTDELVRRGGFGSPTMFVDGGDMYFGNDRLYLVRYAVERNRAQEPSPA